MKAKQAKLFLEQVYGSDRVDYYKTNFKFFEIRTSQDTYHLTKRDGVWVLSLYRAFSSGPSVHTLVVGRLIDCLIILVVHTRNHIDDTRTGSLEGIGVILTQLPWVTSYNINEDEERMVLTLLHGLSTDYIVVHMRSTFGSYVMDALTDYDDIEITVGKGLGPAKVIGWFLMLGWLES